MSLSSTSVSTETLKQFNNEFVKFLSMLKKLKDGNENGNGNGNGKLKKEVKTLYRHYDQMSEGGKRYQFIVKFYKTLKKYKKEINDEDSGLFSEEAQYYAGEQIYLYETYVDLKPVFKNHTINHEQRKMLWKYLKNLMIIAEYVYLDNVNKEKSREYIRKLVENLKQENEIKEEAEKLTDYENKEGLMAEMMKNLTDALGENNLFTELLREITEEVAEIGKDLNGTSAGEMISILFSTKNGDGDDGGEGKDKIRNIMKRLLKKMANLVKSKNLNTEQLQEQIKTIYEKLSSIPILGNIIRQISGGMEMDNSNFGEGLDLSQFTEHLGNLGINIENLDDFKENMDGIMKEIDIEDEKVI